MTNKITTTDVEKLRDLFLSRRPKATIRFNYENSLTNKLTMYVRYKESDRDEFYSAFATWETLIDCYIKDSGDFILDENGEKIPVLDSEMNQELKLDCDGNPIPILDENNMPVYVLDENGMPTDTQEFEKAFSQGAVFTKEKFTCNSVNDPDAKDSDAPFFIGINLVLRG